MREGGRKGGRKIGVRKMSGKGEKGECGGRMEGLGDGREGEGERQNTIE